MGVVEKDQQNMLTGIGDLVIVNGVVARVIIMHQRRSRFLLDWGVAHAGTMDGPHTGGRIELSAVELDQALGMNDVMDFDANAQYLFKRYGATVAVPAKFLRWGRFLNIPGPGTGHPGDANVSIYVDDEICKATKALLQKVMART